MDVRRDYRITVALSWFKKHFPCNELGELLSKAGNTLLCSVIILHYLK